MKIKSYLFLGIACLLAVTACKKHSTPKPGTTSTKIDTDVYIVGTALATNGKKVAAYWKNGAITKLADSSLDHNGQGIAVDGANVYVTGFYIENNNPKSLYWKNGTKMPLTLPDSATSSVAKGIAVNSNGGVYVAGYIASSKGQSAVYWTGNSMTPINLNSTSEGYSVALGVTANATGVYFAGASHSLKKPAISAIATYWTSSRPQLTKDSLWSNANAIALNGPADIYTAGATFTGNIGIATYWKNGDPTHLSPDTDAVAYAIAIKDNMVYTAGYYDNTTTNRIAAYWKGTQRITLSLGDTNTNLDAYPNGIALIGNDVYVSGYTYDLTNHKYAAVCWKNGKIKTLPQGTTTSGIVIVIHTH